MLKKYVQFVNFLVYFSYMKNIIYTGIFLTEESKERLLSKVKDFIPSNWRIYADHLTLGFGEMAFIGEVNTFFKENEGNKIKLRIYEIGISDKAIAVSVEGNFKSANTHPHITIAISPEGRPVHSNYIENWKTIHHFEVEGIVDSFPRFK